MLRRKGVRRRESLHPEGMPSWIAPLFPFGPDSNFPIARYFGRQRRGDLREDGEQEGFPALPSIPDTLFPPGDGTARPDRSELAPHPSAGSARSGTHRADSVLQHHSQGCQERLLQPSPSRTGGKKGRRGEGGAGCFWREEGGHEGCPTPDCGVAHSLPRFAAVFPTHLPPPFPPHPQDRQPSGAGKRLSRGLSSHQAG